MANRSAICLFLALIVGSSGCSGPQEIERSMEGDVEAVFNHLEPYQIEGEPSSLLLEEVMTLDTEDPEVAEAGLVDINAFQVDSEGNIYLLCHGSERYFFFNFSPEGEFVQAFGPKGQGPGELGFPLQPRMLPGDRLAVTDVLKKIMIFDSEGAVVSENRIDPNFVIATPLDSGRSIVFWKAGAEDTAAEYYNEKVSLFSAAAEEIQEMDKLDVGRQARFLDPIVSWHLGRESIFLINEQRGYELVEFALDGSLIRKIRKRFEPVRLEVRIQEALLQGIPDNSPLRDPAVIPDFLPPAHALFSDDDGRLYVATFEKGERREEYWFDVFNREGVFFSRVSLPVHFGRDPFPIYALVRNQHLYCVGEKESGFKRLKVYRMTWQ